MKDKFFLDTNTIVYEFSRNHEKKEKSKKLIKEAHLKNGIISFQVIQEFLNVSTKTFEIPMNIEHLKEYVDKVLYPICEVFPSKDLYINSLEIKERWKFSFYDSLIIAAALEANCKVLFSEDLQHNQKINGLTIINPFL